jgi:death-on-curing protein
LGWAKPRRLSPRRPPPFLFDWLTRDDVAAIHNKRLTQHGGTPGTRDGGQLLLAVLDRPRNLITYEDVDLAALAGCYAYGLASHVFVDGNKRTSLVATLAFLELNGAALRVTEQELWVTWERLGAKAISEAEISAWIRTRMVKL